MNDKSSIEVLITGIEPAPDDTFPDESSNSFVYCTDASGEDKSVRIHKDNIDCSLKTVNYFDSDPVPAILKDNVLTQKTYNV